MTRIRTCLPGLLSTLLLGLDGSAAQPVEGLLLTVRSGSSEAVTAVESPRLHVAAGRAASPLVPAGAFTAEWTGYLNADLRGDYRFKAAVRGGVHVEINGRVVLDGQSGETGFVGPSEEIRLNKGANPVRIRFVSPTEGDAVLRLMWSEYGFLWEPVPRSYLTREAETPALIRDETVLRGRELFLNRRCVRCHESGDGRVPEMTMDAPDLSGVGSRRNSAWLARWIENPRAERPDARMPRVLHGVTSSVDARNIAAFLATQRDTAAAIQPTAAADGAELIGRLHCSGCHQLPGEQDGAGLISLTNVNLKFPQGKLTEFLLQPTRHYRWRRMPDFRLLPAEAAAIAKTLRDGAAPVVDSGLKGDINRGRELVQTTGCLNCHSLAGLGTGLRTVALVELKQPDGGCIKGEGKGPDYGLDTEQAEALTAFLKTDRLSLSRHVPAEFAMRQARDFNCRACHGALEGFPPYERLGGKLKPEYLAALLAGKVQDKPRPWLAHVMPQFPAIADHLAEGLAESHGYAGSTPAEGPVDAELAKIGRQLVGVEGGFSCISCHGVGDLQPTQVFEAEGINLALPARRLQKDYYFRWVLNPLKIEPQTKMPVYFDEEGNSPLFDVLDGKATRQLEAFWHYMRAGDAIKPPALPGF